MKRLAILVALGLTGCVVTNPNSGLVDADYTAIHEATVHCALEGKTFKALDTAVMPSTFWKQGGVTVKGVCLDRTASTIQ